MHMRRVVVQEGSQTDLLPAVLGYTKSVWRLEVDYACVEISNETKQEGMNCVIQS